MQYLPRTELHQDGSGAPDRRLARKRDPRTRILNPETTAASNRRARNEVGNIAARATAPVRTTRRLNPCGPHADLITRAPPQLARHRYARNRS
jgi:hypothetical protein